MQFLRTDVECTPRPSVSYVGVLGALIGIGVYIWTTDGLSRVVGFVEP